MPGCATGSVGFAAPDPVPIGFGGGGSSVTAPADPPGRVLEGDGRRLVIVEFDRTGLKGPERVRQYSFPQSANLYRIVCSAPKNDFAKYEVIFAHVAASFRIKPAS